MAFVCGFLPVYDGEPEKRSKIVDRDIWIYHTRKVYPWFANTIDQPIKGVGYKKFFYPNENGCVYSLPFEGKTYIYFDIFNNCELCYEIKGNVKPLETFGVEYSIENGKLIVKGNKGFATFIEE